MITLLLRLAGPLQSWGVQSRFTERDTGLEPSKSGIIGLLCTALGRPRHEDLAYLTALKMGVRVDREGILKMDFHTAGGAHRRGDKYGVAKADGSKPDTVISRRYYLADADFLVGLEGKEELLKGLDAALSRPVWPPYLGRKAFVPGGPLGLGLVDLPMEQALRSYPWLARTNREKARMLRQLDEGNCKLRLLLDAPFGSTAEVRPDVPLSFAERRFSLRYVKTDFMDLTPEMIQEATHVSLPSAS
ncbi:MAG: type I-E CRISPR-associated protein Cas5/CasD [Desulfobaccales bacterium]|jgi:CRISPR system Cascade subunit CasD